MTERLKLIGVSADQLCDHVLHQLNFIRPLGNQGRAAAIRGNMPAALERLRVCINSVALWRENEFNPLHSSQYCTFLYYLANTIWREAGDADTATELFSLNKALNGIDLFYEIEMPSRFFIGHSVGIVFAKATYSDYLAVYQNSTIGKNHGIAPVIESGVVMYPNSAIIGRCHVRSGTVVAQGVSVINRETPGNCIAFNSAGNELVCKTAKRRILEDIFRVQ